MLQIYTKGGKFTYLSGARERRGLGECLWASRALLVATRHGHGHCVITCAAIRVRLPLAHRCAQMRGMRNLAVVTNLVAGLHFVVSYYIHEIQKLNDLSKTRHIIFHC